MNEPQQRLTGLTYDGAEDEALRSLFARAGSRPAALAEDLEAVHGAALGAFRSRHAAIAAAHPSRPAARFGGLRLAAAALVLVAVALAFLRPWRRDAVEGVATTSVRPAATVERLLGAATVTGGHAGSIRVALAAGAELPGGATLETDADGGTALRLAGGASLRVAAASRLRFEDGEAIALERGAVYVDTGAAGSEAPARGVTVVTPAGTFRDVGTQFEVRLASGASTRLRVREGSVRFAPPPRAGTSPAEELAAAGDELAIDGAGGFARATIASYDEEWSWVVESAPPLAIDGLTARAFLDWAAREQGLRLEFTDERASAVASETVLRGSIEGLPLAETPAAVLASCGLDATIEAGRLRISVRTPS